MFFSTPHNRCVSQCLSILAQAFDFARKYYLILCVTFCVFAYLVNCSDFAQLFLSLFVHFTRLFDWKFPRLSARRRKPAFSHSAASGSGNPCGRTPVPRFFPGAQKKPRRFRRRGIEPANGRPVSSQA